MSCHFLAILIVPKDATLKKKYKTFMPTNHRFYIDFSLGAGFPHYLLSQKVKVFFNENNTNFCVSDIIKFSKETLGFCPQADKK